MVSVLIGALSAIGTHVLTLEATRSRMRRELEHEADRELRGQRRAAYVELWKRLEALSLYAPPHQVDAGTLLRLSAGLRDWYYTVGGVFLTEAAKQRYFALQDLLQVHATRPEPIRPADRRYRQKPITTGADGPGRYEVVGGGPMSEADQVFFALFDAASALRSQVAADLDSRAPLMSGHD